MWKIRLCVQFRRNKRSANVRVDLALVRDCNAPYDRLVPELLSISCSLQTAGNAFPSCRGSGSGTQLSRFYFPIACTNTGNVRVLRSSLFSRPQVLKHLNILVSVLSTSFWSRRKFSICKRTPRTPLLKAGYAYNNTIPYFLLSFRRWRMSRSNP